jgi:hypothetical protein
MAVYQFSALADGQAISFNPSVDQLNFDQTTDQRRGGDDRDRRHGPSVHRGGKSIALSNTAITQLAGSNITFANGSLLLVGDNSAVGTNDHAANTLIGGAGADQIQGLGGNDSINGGGGNDWISGGSGNDTLTAAAGGHVRLLPVRDRSRRHPHRLRRQQLGQHPPRLVDVHSIGAVGRFAAGDVRFFAGTAAHDADDRIIYNSATGQLWYDADGNGSGSAELIATLSTRPGMVANDIWVFGTTTPPPPPPPSGQTINGTAGDDSLVGGTATTRSTASPAVTGSKGAGATTRSMPVTVMTVLMGRRGRHAERRTGQRQLHHRRCRFADRCRRKRRDLQLGLLDPGSGVRGARVARGGD